MIEPSKSYLQVQYDVRPAKQVERRMFVDAFQRLSEVGFQVREYQYTGFGLFYFVDFILFHKFVGINKMLTIEHYSHLEKRVRFNKPFDFVRVAIGEAVEIIPFLSRDELHILWLDYDEPIREDRLREIYLAASHLSRRSLLVVTVDIDRRALVDRGEKVPETPREVMEIIRAEAGPYFGLPESEDFAARNLPRTSLQIILNALNEGLVGRPEIEFLPLFHFVYADGHQMLTIGGMLGGAPEKNMIRGIDLNKVSYLRTDFNRDPYEIIVPRLTRKERHFLDSAMPCGENWKPSEFDLREGDISAYREIYRFLPVYAELLI